MSETKTFVVPDNLGGNNNDLATMAMMNNGGFGNGMWNNPFIYLIWLWFARMWNNQDLGDPAVQRLLQTLQDLMLDNHNSDLLMLGINGNTDAIRTAAEKMGCNFNTLNLAVCGIASSIKEVGGLVGFSSERVINAVNVGDSNIIQALNTCCCNTQKSILETNYQNQLANERQTYQLTNSIDSVGKSVERGFCDTAYATLAQTCSLQNSLRDISTANTNQIVAKLDAMQNQALLDKIDTLREKNSEQAVIINNAQLSAMFSQMINAATAPISASLTGLTKEVADIQCKLPQTVTLPYSCATAVPTNLVYGGLYGSTNSLWG